VRAFHDTDEHRALVQRTLGVSAAQWDSVVGTFRASTSEETTVEARLAALTQAFASVVPPAKLRTASERCPVCGATVHPCADDGQLLFGACEACGHGVLLLGAAAPTVYDDRYYRERRSGAGYERYREEQTYRETKGRRIVERLMARHGAAPRTLLEVGSGFGFTRAAAESLGLSTAGVDLNPEAARVAHELYGMKTTTGTSSHLEGAFDLVLHQFVLEHVPSVQAEVSNAHRLTAAGGLACFIIPSMEAVERTAFHSRYRSFRADHLHLFSRRSITSVLEGAGFTEVQVDSECNLHLLAGFLTRAECAALYGRGAGPDLVATARRP